MGTCGIASGAREVLDTLLQEIEAAKVNDIIVTTSGCMGLCSREPLVTVEVMNQDAIKYEYMNPNKMRQVFKRHILDGEIQLPFVLARGAEIIK
jgi:NADP-reducing hydrogenase subunit HndB